MRTVVLVLLCCAAPASADFAVTATTHVVFVSDPDYRLDDWTETVSGGGDGGAFTLGLARIPAQLTGSATLAFTLSTVFRVYEGLGHADVVYQEDFAAPTFGGVPDFGRATVSNATIAGGPLVIGGVAYTLIVDLPGRAAGIPGLLAVAVDLSATAPAAPAAVPEPASVALLGAGLAGACVIGRRGRRAGIARIR